jgi:transposase-like protein
MNPQKKCRTTAQEIKATVAQDRDLVRELIQIGLQEILEAEMEETLGAGKHQRTGARKGYRSGYYERGLLTRVGAIELRVPQDRDGRFSTEVFERYQRSEKALVWALIQMYVEGVSTRKVKAITEELCGQEFSASTVSRLVSKLDGDLEQFAQRRLEEPFAYLMVDARYERVREAGVIQHRAVQIAVGVDYEGRRQILAVELANRESESSWKQFLLALKERGLHGVELVVSDDHAGLTKAIRETFTEAAWQRCYVHFLRNALDYLPRKADDDCLTERRWLYDRKDVQEARRDLATWLKKWSGTYGRLCDWVEANIEQTFTFYRLPRAHHKHLKSTNMLERLNEEIKRRTQVVRIFPNAGSALRLIRALAVETHEEWIEATRYLDMQLLKEHKKELALAAAA